MTQLHLSPSKRNTNLASLCRVNHHFLGIARPLLYHEIHLDPSLHRNKTSSTYSTLLHSVILIRPCAIFVRSIKLTLKVDVNAIDLILLAISLKACTGLERLSTGWNEWKGSEADRARLFEIISQDATSVKQLEIGSISLPIQPTLQLARALRHLDRLVFKPIDIKQRLPPQFRLRQVVCVERTIETTLESLNDRVNIMNCRTNL